MTEACQKCMLEGMDLRSREVMKKDEEEVLRAMLESFKEKDPKDPIGAMGRAYAKRSCSNCYGRGVILGVEPGAKETDKRMITFCGCARKRMAPVVQARLMLARAKTPAEAKPETLLTDDGVTVSLPKAQENP